MEKTPGERRDVCDDNEYYHLHARLIYKPLLIELG
jgi:hypothetical protein